TTPTHDTSTLSLHDALPIYAAAELGLANIEFRQMDVMEMTVDDFGTFDYITAHGLISWIPEPVGDRVPALMKELMTADGVGYIRDRKSTRLNSSHRTISYAV